MGMSSRSVIVAGCIATFAAVVISGGTRGRPEEPQVRILRVPEGGIEPQTVVGPDGTLRMTYFTGNAGAGDIEYVREAPGEKDFSRPIRVNSQPASAVAVGTVRGPQMAVGRNGRVYVVWFGSAAAQPRGPGGVTPVLYTRLNAAGTAFEPERSVMQYAVGADGGLSVAADQRGDVYVVWHATGKLAGEAHRRVVLARSTDDGKSFAREVPISPDGLGACGCCGMRATVDRRGALYVLFRAASEGIHRDMTLLVSDDLGRTFHSSRVYPWQLDACPMTTADLAQAANGVLAAWETAGEVYFADVDPASYKLSPARPAPGQADDRKHPAVAANSNGEILMAWTEGTAWMKGGSLAWQVFDRRGKPIGAEGHAPNVPVWDAPSVFASHSGDFTIIY
jgi:hypothetical protein